MQKGFLTIGIALFFASGVSAKETIADEYICTVAEKASIASIHLEGAGPPKAMVDDRLPTRFKIRITGEGEQFRLEEIPYGGTDRDPMEWHTGNSILHSSYMGDGNNFSATGGDKEAFFVIGPTIHTSKDGVISFYHSGFEWAGGEDTNLSIRWGRCKPT